MCFGCSKETSFDTFFPFLSLIFFFFYPIILDDPRVICVAIFSLHICLYELAPHVVIFIYNLSVPDNLKLETVLLSTHKELNATNVGISAI